MTARMRQGAGFWWDGDPSERYWLEQLKTDTDGDRLFAPDTGTYRVMHAVDVGDLVLHWFSERRPDVGPGRSGIYAVSRVVGPARAAADRWEGRPSIDVPLTAKIMLDRPVLLADLKRREEELRRNRDELLADIGDAPHYSMWQFPRRGLKPVVRYLSKLSTADLEIIVADHPHLTAAMTQA